MLISSGDTVNGALFSTFGGFWVVLPAYLEWFSKAVPAATARACHRAPAVHVCDHRGDVPFGLAAHHGRHAAGADQSARPLLLLAAGNYGARPILLHIGGVTGIILAGHAMYLVAAENCEVATCEKAVIPLGLLGD